MITIDEKGSWKALKKGEAVITVSILDSDALIKEVPVTITEAKPTVKASGKITSMAGNVVPDPELKKTINIELGRAEDTDMTIADLESITSLNYYGPYLENSTEPRLASLEGLQYAINLESVGFLHADFSNPDSIASIENLVNLKGIEMSHSKLTSGSLHYLINSN